MKFFNTHLTLRQRTSRKGFFKKLFGYFLQRQALSSCLSFEASFGLRIELDSDGRWEYDLWVGFSVLTLWKTKERRGQLPHAQPVPADSNWSRT